VVWFNVVVLIDLYSGYFLIPKPIFEYLEIDNLIQLFAKAYGKKEKNNEE